MTDSSDSRGFANPHAQPSIAPIEVIRSAIRNRNLILALIQRELASRYQGAGLGFVWAILNPLIMVAIYTFVFGVAFKARWVGGTGATAEFALMLFCGLVVYSILSECLLRAPMLVVSNPNYVKKVIFPLETLPFVIVGSALFNAFVSFCVWFVVCVLFLRMPNATSVLLPVVIIPLVLVSLGVTWLLSSLGVFLRDLAQIVPFVSTVLLFMSPVFYPLASLPKIIQPFIFFNPLTLPIESARAVLFLGGGVDWSAWSLSLVMSLIFCYLCFVWFQKTRKGFADVV